MLQHWPNPLQQHDSGEFHRYILTFLQPPAYDGEWQARLSNPCQITDSGRLTTPILVHPTGNTLAELIGGWRQQYAVRALSHHKGLLILRIVRFDFADTTASKNTSPIYVTPGEAVAVPIFVGHDDLKIRFETFRVAYQLYHLGQNVESGHYRCALSVPAGPPDNPTWSYYVCDYSKAPVRAKPADLRTIAASSYLVWLIRSRPRS